MKAVLESLVCGHLVFCQSQKTGGVVVEDVSLLFGCEEWGLFDRADRGLDQAGPDHLVGAEHYTLAIAVIDDAAEKPVKPGSRFDVVEHA